MIKLIVTDMDGTFLDDNKKFPQEFWNIYEKLKKKNIRFVVASGRQYQNLKNIFNKIKNEIIFIAENGSFVVSKEKETYSKVLSREIVLKYLEIGRKIKSCNLVLCGKKSAYIEKTDKMFLNEVKKYYDKIEVVKNLNEVVDDELIKIAFCDLTGTEKNVYPYMRNEKDCQIVISGEIWLDVSHLESNKGIALEYIQKKFKITEEETMAFGDYLNDYEMLKKAKYSYAMKNAHYKVKEICKEITDSNNEYGVLKVIKEKVLDE